MGFLITFSQFSLAVRPAIYIQYTYNIHLCIYMSEELYHIDFIILFSILIAISKSLLKFYETQLKFVKFFYIFFEILSKFYESLSKFYGNIKVS